MLELPDDILTAPLVLADPSVVKDMYPLVSVAVPDFNCTCPPVNLAFPAVSKTLLPVLWSVASPTDKLISPDALSSLVCPDWMVIFPELPLVPGEPDAIDMSPLFAPFVAVLMLMVPLG